MRAFYDSKNEGGFTLSFGTLEFIFRFLPVFLVLYYVIPYRYRNLVLLAGSICFYTVGEKKYIWLLLLSVLFNYWSAIHISKYRDNPSLRKTWFVVTLFYDFGMLFLFKYLNFFIQSINALTVRFIPGDTFQLPAFSAVLPLGISFYTFQIVSYIIDVYTEKIKAEKALLNLGTYLCMFPQLISGPIVAYSDIKPQLSRRRYSLSNIESGLKLFAIGLGFKVLIANKIGILWNDIQTIGFESISTPLAWLGMFGYSIQLYFDFQGYTLMAIGVGKMLGFTLPENFNHPYMSKSVSEFWRRWHMTLGTWFKKYIYIPMGGNRKGTKRLAFNLLIVWMFTGLWHGANWNFVCWGLALFILIFIEKIFLKKYLDKSLILSRIYVLAVIPMTWMLFAITDFKEIFVYFGRLLSFTPGINVNTHDFIKYLGIYKWLFLLGIFFSMPFAKKWYEKHENSLPCILFLLVVFWYSIYQIANGANNPFVYFRF